MSRLSPLIFKFTRRGPFWLYRKITGRTQNHKRQKIASQYLNGQGLEIGALHNPLPLPQNTQAIYIDRMSAADLRKHYPELSQLSLIEPDIIDHGETLQSIKNLSQDFIIANHFIEHCEDPIGTIATHLQKLKTGGHLFYALPDRSLTFVDYQRQLTTFDHLKEDYFKGVELSRSAHYLSWAKESLRSSNPQKKATELMGQKYSIHFHVWNKKSFFEFCQQLQKLLNNSFSIRHLEQNLDEFIAILKKE